MACPIYIDSIFKNDCHLRKTEASNRANLFNPGKIVDPPKMDDRSLFRYRPDYRIGELKTALAREGDPIAALAAAEQARDAAAEKLTAARAAVEAQQAHKAELQSARDAASSTLASAKAELAGLPSPVASSIHDGAAEAFSYALGHSMWVLVAVGLAGTVLTWWLLAGQTTGSAAVADAEGPVPAADQHHYAQHRRPH